MPGQAKIVSVTTEKAISEPSSRPRIVTIGIMMFLRMCTSTIRDDESPLALAKRT